MDSKKKILKAVIFLLLAAAFYGIGTITDIWSLVPLPTANLSLAKAIQCGVIIFATLFAENLIVFLLGLIKTENHRKRTALSLINNLMRYIAVVVIICGIIAALFADAGSVFAGLGILALIIGFGAESLISDVVTGAFILVDSEPHHPNSRVSYGWCFPTFRDGTHYHTYGQDSVLVLTKRSQNRVKANECG